MPIVWGGAFPTVCPEAALNAPYVDYAVRGQGEQTFIELLEALGAGGGSGTRLDRRADVAHGRRGRAQRGAPVLRREPRRETALRDARRIRRNI